MTSITAKPNVSEICCESGCPPMEPTQPIQPMKTRMAVPIISASATVIFSLTGIFGAEGSPGKK